MPGKHASDARGARKGDGMKGDGTWIAALTALAMLATAVVTLIATLLGLYLH